MVFKKRNFGKSVCVSVLFVFPLVLAQIPLSGCESQDDDSADMENVEIDSIAEPEWINIKPGPSMHGGTGLPVWECQRYLLL